MKRIIAMITVAMMAIGMMSTAAFADEIVHNGSLPATSSKEVKITINSLSDSSSGGGTNVLPSEYHVLVNWDVLDGVYDATNSDSEEEDGFKNFTWDCVKLDYTVNDPGTTGEDDPRSANWTQKPKVAFEVLNASAPDLSISASVALEGEDTWAQFISSNPVTGQFTTPTTIAPVSKGNMGTGVESASEGKTGIGTDAENDEDYEYELNWNYTALNEYALQLYKDGNPSAEFTNKFVVTINAA